ncbi:MAG TPA: LAGLIDADG family homing endonuclease [Thermoplasmata archaeon]|nr:LAGLIDADG family homing endonuclease [Thermoplasmata archaeon]
MVAARTTLPAPVELQGRWVAVLEEAGLRPRILRVFDRYPEERSLEIDFGAIDAIDTALADLLLERPEEVLEAGVRAMRELLPVSGPDAEGLRLRVLRLPSTAVRLVRSIRESDLNRLLAIDGIVRRVSEVRPQIRDAVFECVACKTKFHEPQDEASLVFREPLECPECGKAQGRTRFRLVAEESTYVDAQRIEIQERPETLKHGAHPQGLSVLMVEDLAGKILPGNRLVLNGILKSFQRASAGRGGVVRNTTFDVMVLANSFESKSLEYTEIEISPDDVAVIERFRGDPTVVDKIVLSLAPTIKGMEEEKEAIALQLFGGVTKTHADGIRVRGDIHVLLVGDPGVAKSQLLRYISQVAPRGIYTSGKGTTAAGLTAAAVKDDFAGGRWMLEAGMLVLADGGMAVIDELDKMNADDRSAMHEVLEQQSYPPSFELMLLNGERRPIGEFVEGWFRRHPERLEPTQDGQLLRLGEERCELLSTDFRTLEGVAVERVSRHRAPERFVRLGFGNGRSLTVTPEHPVFVWRDGGWAEVPAASVRPGELCPGVRGYPRSLNEAVLRPPEGPTGSPRLRLPDGLTPELTRLLGYLASAGPLRGARPTSPDEVSFAHADPTVAAEVGGLLRSVFGVDPQVGAVPARGTRGALRSTYEVRAASPELLGFLGRNFPELAREAPERRIPGPVFHAGEDSRREFLVGAYRGAGFCESGRFGLTAPSEALARDCADLLLSLGIYASLSRSRPSGDGRRRGRSHRVVVSGPDSQRRFLERVARDDPSAPRVRRAVERSERRPRDDDRFPVDLVRRLTAPLGGLVRYDGSWGRLDRCRHGVHRSVLERYLHRAGSRLDALAALRTSRATAREVRQAFRLPLAELARELGRSPSWVARHDREPGSAPGREILRAVDARAASKLERLRSAATALEEWIDAPWRFVPVREVEVVPNPGEPWVYDVTVEPNHTFVGEGLVLHNSVSIAKAGITSTLNARCPVLAAANPKLGRFTNERPISEQIDLPPTLLSRFDVIFSIRDVPNQERDRRLANRILASHRDVELAGAGRPEGELAPFSPELLKKFVAFARAVRPRLTDEALQVIEDYYVRVRKQGEEPDAPVPITARQLEALVRMSEAAARARLSDVVRPEDAQRAVRIMDSYLRRVAMTPEGRIDIDITQIGVSHSQREQFEIARTTMRELQGAPGGQFSLPEYLEAMARHDITAARAEGILQTLRNQGEIIEPRTDRYQLTRF